MKSKKKIADIQIGDVTHHQDQSICPVSFSTKKIKNNTDGKPNPLSDDFCAIT